MAHGGFMAIKRESTYTAWMHAVSTYRSAHVFSKKLVAKHQLLEPNLSPTHNRLYGVVVVDANSMAYLGGSSPL